MSWNPASSRRPAPTSTGAAAVPVTCASTASWPRGRPSSGAIPESSLRSTVPAARQIELPGRRPRAGDRQLGVRADERQRLDLHTAPARGDEDRSGRTDPEVGVPACTSSSRMRPRRLEGGELSLRELLPATRAEPGGARPGTRRAASSSATSGADGTAWAGERRLPLERSPLRAARDDEPLLLRRARRAAPSRATRPRATRRRRSRRSGRWAIDRAAQRGRPPLAEPVQRRWACPRRRANAREGDVDVPRERRQRAPRPCADAVPRRSSRAIEPRPRRRGGCASPRGPSRSRGRRSSRSPAGPRMASTAPAGLSRCPTPRPVDHVAHPARPGEPVADRVEQVADHAPSPRSPRRRRAPGCARGRRSLALPAGQLSTPSASVRRSRKSS